MPPMTGAAEQFFTGLIASVYFLPFMAGTQVVCGALLLLGMWVPLALVALAPVILNIIFYHAFVAPQGLGMAAFICVLEIYLAFFAAPYCGVVKQLFTNPKK
jgi:putative oxidoreductase